MLINNKVLTLLYVLKIFSDIYVFNNNKASLVIQELSTWNKGVIFSRSCYALNGLMIYGEYFARDGRLIGRLRLSLGKRN